jgi:hypothetical protein
LPDTAILRRWSGADAALAGDPAFVRQDGESLADGNVADREQLLQFRCRRNDVALAILTVEYAAAQGVCHLAILRRGVGRVHGQVFGSVLSGRAAPAN